MSEFCDYIESHYGLAGPSYEESKALHAMCQTRECHCWLQKENVMTHSRRKFTLARPVTRKECPWLGRDYEAGEQVFAWPGYTYGCVRPSGVAVSAQYNMHPFFELPAEAVQP